MTHEEIDMMPAGREMDVAIAEQSMGYRWERPSYLQNSDLFVAPNTDEVGYRYEGRAPVYYEGLPHYSTDIAAAWQVVESLRAMGFVVLISSPRPVHAWGVEAWHLDVEHDRRRGEAYADTAPLAICRAALKAVRP